MKECPIAPETETGTAILADGRQQPPISHILELQEDFREGRAFISSLLVPGNHFENTDLFWVDLPPGMPKEKYEPPDPRRMYTIMSSEEAANGKKSHWAELEISDKLVCGNSLVEVLTLRQCFRRNDLVILVYDIVSVPKKARKGHQIFLGLELLMILSYL
ncbi:hypothetical protein STEG23_007407, partial [Scotinomys teguina]